MQDVSNTKNEVQLKMYLNAVTLFPCLSFVESSVDIHLALISLEIKAYIHF